MRKTNKEGSDTDDTAQVIRRQLGMNMATLEVIFVVNMFAQE